MRKYTKKDLFYMIRNGLAIDITEDKRDSIPKDYKKIGYTTGTYGISGGIIQDRETGERYAITTRNILLLTIF